MMTPAAARSNAGADPVERILMAISSAHWRALRGHSMQDTTYRLRVGSVHANQRLERETVTSSFACWLNSRARPVPLEAV
jgi:hypothetical protein